MHSIPLLPRRIAVISSDTAAGYGDFCHQLRHNPRSFSFDITLFPALMQGDKAAASIVEALDLVAERLSDFDLVVIIRGGGATTDLTCFDAYDLAAHCAQFPLPIVAGIGHLRDTSVLDMVVHTSLKTPTAVAEFLLQAFLLQDDMLVQFGRRVSQALQQRLLQQNHTVEQLQLRVFSLMHRHLLGEKNKLDLAEKTIELHSPQRILKQGYSLTHVAGRVLTSADEVKPGDRLVTEFADGTITSIVE
jgi:exodeoxyribonuclease VII large subunit